MTVKRVAIIGAGASGLAAIKCCLDEGLEPVCFERTDYIGGLWHYTEDVEDGQGCVMKSTVINTSKEMMCYSDYPIPGDYAIFMHNTYVDKYFHLYADQFKLKQYIQFKVEVNSIKPAENFSTNGRWVITKTDKTTKVTSEELFDAVMVCTGHHADTNFPSFPGQEKFKGKIMHSHDYKSYEGLEGKRVVVVGIGNSGGDIAVELSRLSSQVYLSTRRGAWISHRVADNGSPFDMLLSTRLFIKLLVHWPWFSNKMARLKFNHRFNHKRYSLEPNCQPLAQHPTVNDDLPNKIASRSVIIKSNIQSFTENGVIFDDGTKEDVDVVIFATGYIFGFPFLDSSIVDVKDNQVNLFKYIFPPDLELQTLAVIGCFQPLGAIMPISETQCRVVTRVFKDQLRLPTKTEMLEDIRKKREMMSQRYVTSKRHTIQVDYIPYMDELSQMAGFKPDIGKLLLADPKLALTCFFGPATPYQYRLMGPGSWKGARDNILTQWDRTFKPLQTRKCDLPEKGNAFNIFIMLLIAIAVLLYYFV